MGKNEDTGNVHSQATLLCTLLGSAACFLKYLIYAALHQQFRLRLLQLNNAKVKKSARLFS